MIKFLKTYESFNVDKNTGAISGFVGAILKWDLKGGGRGGRGSYIGGY